MADTERPLGTGIALLTTLPAPVRQVLVLIGLAAAVAAGVALVLWSQSEQMSPLYSGLSDRDAGEIAALLDGSAVPYKLDPATGALLVPADRKYEVRMQVAAAGLPRGTGFGIEDIREHSSFGQTPFMENALYVRAVETELARTISSMQPVESARVHLALPPQSAFIRQKREPSASVMLKLYAGRRLDPTQVQAVVNLVASSIPDLVPSRVTVVDQTGALLTNPGGGNTATLTSTQFEYRQQVEEQYARRIEGLLASVVGPGRVRATVSADLDFTVTEQTRESFDPSGAVVRSEQTSEDTRRAEVAQGIPGALSNQPPETAAATPVPSPAEAAQDVAVSRSAVRNFEIDKTVSHTKQAVGTIRRLSIGVLVDHKPPATPEGEPQPLGEQELASLTELVKQAVGFDETRGDSISVLNSPFQPTVALSEPEPLPLWQQPEVLALARQASGAVLVLALAFFVLRPMVQVLTRPQVQPKLAAVTADGGAEPPAQLTGGAPTSSAPATGAPAMLALPVSYEDRVAAARSVASQDPRQVAQVVRNWVAEDNG